MSEFEEFIEDNFKELKSRIESGNFFAKTMRDSMHATWLKQQSEIDQLKYERDAFQEFHRDCKAEIDQLKAEKAGLESQLHEVQKLSTTWRIKKVDATRKNEANKAFYFGKCANELESALSKALRGEHE